MDNLMQNLMNVGRKHFGNDLIETKINHCGYLISLGDQGNKSSIDTLINDPIVLEFQETLFKSSLMMPQ